jgi:hypothetical protein
MIKHWALTDEAVLRFAYPLAAFALGLLVLLIVAIYDEVALAPIRPAKKRWGVSCSIPCGFLTLWCIAAAVQFVRNLDHPGEVHGRASTAIVAFHHQPQHGDGVGFGAAHYPRRRRGSLALSGLARH